MHSHRRIICLTLAMACAPLVGCGGGPSKSDLLERARMRSAMNKINDEAQVPVEDPDDKQLEPRPAAGAQAAAPAPTTGAPPETDDGKPASGPSAVVAAEQPAGAVTLNPLERDRRAAEKLGKIAAAVLAYADQHGEFPQQGYKGLSWRVKILPQLGYEELYHQFNLKQAWDGPQNRQLLGQVPDVYRAPGASDNHTSFFAASGPATIFWHPGRVTSFRSLGENSANTLMLVEVSDKAAVPWTQPTDYQRDLVEPTKGLDSRGDAPLVAWADGAVTRLLTGAPTNKINEAFRLYEEDEKKTLKINSITAPVEQAADVAAAGGDPSAPGGGASVTTVRRSASGGAATQPCNDLADSYLAAAQAAFAHGRRIEAWQWLSGAIAAGLPPAEWRDDFRWVPGLRRPTLGPHIAVGVLLDVASERGLRRDASMDELVAFSLAATAPVGADLVRILDEHAAERLPSLLQDPTTPAAGRTRPNQAPGVVSCLPPSTHMAELRRDAIASGADVLALMSVDTSATGRSRSVELRLYDLQRGANQLLRVRKVTASVDQRVLDEPTEERMQAARWQLKDFLQDALSPTEWPVKLTAPLVAKRMASLASEQEEQPLPELIEMLHYRDLGLADDVQMLRAANGLIGEDRGAPLMLGDDQKKRRVLRHYLPSDDPEAVIALAERRRRNADKD